MYQIAQFYRRFPVEIVIYSAWLYSTLPQTFDLLTALLTHYCQVERTWQGEVGFGIMFSWLIRPYFHLKQILTSCQ